MSLLIRRIPAGEYQTNCYILVCLRTLETVIIDPGDDADRLLDGVEGFDFRYILLTHGHPDHTGALAAAKKRLDVPLAYHPLDNDLVKTRPDISLIEGMDLLFGECILRVLHVPGHTPGSVGFLIGPDLFGGDTLFPGGPGHTKSESDLAQLVQSLRDKIMRLPEGTAVYPGHGAETTVGRERAASRDFLARFDAGWRGHGDLTWESR